MSSLQWIPLTSAIQTSSSESFQIQYQSLGEPSCALITYTIASNVTYLIGLIGTSQSICNTTFPSYAATMSQNFIGNYLTLASSNMLSFTSSKITKSGNNILTANFSNARSSIITKTNITAVSQLGVCDLPSLNILNRTAVFYNPKIYLRSSIIDLQGQTLLNCPVNLNNTKQWYIYNVDKATGNQLSLVTLSNNPTVNYAELVIQPNTLGFGLYKAVYQVTMSYNTIYTSQIETYFEIDPAGLVISSIYGSPGGGTYETNRGIGQTIQLTPVYYSYDIDGIATISKLKFQFYCSVIDNGISYDPPQLYSNVFIDMLTLQKNYSSNPNIQSLVQSSSTPSCFNSISIF